ncbi:MAG: hypothetical protein IPI64_10540 [Chloracidobacterium sp.]|nr:hypothetical protein [Chloracidobacterium sp.]
MITTRPISLSQITRPLSSKILKHTCVRGLSNALTAKGIDVAGDTNNEAAIALFEEAVKYDKQNDVAYAKAGAIYDANGKNDKAALNYEKALAINPAYTMLYPPLGVAYLNNGEIAKAETTLQKLAAGIDTVETRYLNGVILFKQNKKYRGSRGV